MALCRNLKPNRLRPVDQQTWTCYAISFIEILAKLNSSTFTWESCLKVQVIKTYQGNIIDSFCMFQVLTTSDCDRGFGGLAYWTQLLINRRCSGEPNIALDLVVVARVLYSHDFTDAVSIAPPLPLSFPRKTFEETTWSQQMERTTHICFGDLLQTNVVTPNSLSFCVQFLYLFKLLQGLCKMLCLEQAKNYMQEISRLNTSWPWSMWMGLQGGGNKANVQSRHDSQEAQFTVTRATCSKNVTNLVILGINM